MQDRPASDLLLDAVSRFLGSDVAPTVADPALAFRLRIAQHVLAGLAREVREQGELDPAHLAALHELLGVERPIPPAAELPATIRATERELAVRIRQADLDPAEMSALGRGLAAIALTKARVGNPRYGPG